MFNDPLAHHPSQQSLRADIKFLTGLLTEVIRQQEGDELLSKIEEIRTLAKQIRADKNPMLVQSQKQLIEALTLPESFKMARAFTVYFQLVNIAEEVQRIRRLRDYDRSLDVAQEMSLRKLFRELIDQGYQVEDILTALEQCEISPVLTAHPTEAKRRTVLDHLFYIANQLAVLDRQDLTLGERDYLTVRIKETLEILWQTTEIRTRKVSVKNEIEHTLYFFDRTIIDLIANIHDKIYRELRFMGYKDLRVIEPFIHFGSWVGADRDGNPFVTPEITLETVYQQRRKIIGYYIKSVQSLIRRFSQSVTMVTVSKKLLESVEAERKFFPDLAKQLEQTEDHEYYRNKLTFIERRLELSLNSLKGGYLHAEAFIDDLLMIEESLAKHGGVLAIHGDFRRLLIQARAFRFCLAVLDFRDHTSKIRQTINEVLSTDNLELSQVVDHLLKNKTPRWPALASAEAKDVCGQLKVFDHLRHKVDPKAVDAYILSMTQSPVDVLSFLYLAKLSGLVKIAHRKVKQASIGVVPLFETIEALNTSHQIMDTLLSIPIYRSYIKQRGDWQEIMLGYSDSCKDGGYLAANWYLYQAQKNLVEVGRKHGVQIKFFHGKGGTIDRGGGASHQAILAQPHAANGGRIKITEQGEVISQKYAHPSIAKRNLEQMITAVISTQLLIPKKKSNETLIGQWESVMQELTQYSYQAYRQLVYETPGFLDFYHQATPINIFKITKIGSRPSARFGKPSFDQLRAIPWVFSWVQSRYSISAWFGVGQALRNYLDRYGEEGILTLREMYQQWPFFNSIIHNLQISLAKSDLYIAQLYAENVEDESLGRQIHEMIERDFNFAVDAVLLITQQKELLDYHQVLKESIKVRNPYVDPLNYLQVRFMRLKSKATPQTPEAKLTLMDEILLLTVNGIASGMKSTG